MIRSVGDTTYMHLNSCLLKECNATLHVSMLGHAPNVFHVCFHVWVGHTVQRPFKKFFSRASQGRGLDAHSHECSGNCRREQALVDGSGSFYKYCSNHINLLLQTGIEGFFFFRKLFCIDCQNDKKLLNKMIHICLHMYIYIYIIGHCKPSFAITA